MSARVNASVLACLVVCAGCTRGPALGEVSGVVTLDGQPLSGVVVVFQPTTGRPSLAETDAQGRFTLDYTVHRRGALVGPMEVHLQPSLEIAANDFTAAAAKKFPVRYLKAFETVEVRKGKNEFKFELTRNEEAGR